MIEKSDSIKELANALHQAQGEMPALPMDGDNQFTGSRFTSLGVMIEIVQPILGKHNLSISQFPTTDEKGYVGITTILLHAPSGEWMTSTVTLPLVDEKKKNTAQLAGSIISYLRRYSLSAILGLYSDEDIDGEVTTKTKPAQKARQPVEYHTEQSERGWPTRPWDAGTLKRAMAKKVADYKGKSAEPSEAQLDYCRSSFGNLNLDDAERHTITLYLFDVGSTGDLTAAQCSALIDWIGAKAPNYTPSQDAKIEAVAVIKEYQKMKGQQELQI